MFQKNRIAATALVLCTFVGLAIAQQTGGRTLEGWGKVVDPDGDCKVESAKGSLSISLSGTHHNLNPAISQNAPRVLREVEGDFTAQVRVSGDFEPGQRSTLNGGVPFNGAGLVIWQDARNFLRLERNAWRVAGVEGAVCYPPLFELYRDGTYQQTDPEPKLATFFEKSTYFRMKRRGDIIMSAYSHDGKDWLPLSDLKVSFPPKVQVGVAAVSTSANAFTAKFDEFKVTADK
jgi:regulation of enolase protein 1 (concanavalin A-like superfamily)